MKILDIIQKELHGIVSGSDLIKISENIKTGLTTNINTDGSDVILNNIKGKIDIDTFEFLEDIFNRNAIDHHDLTIDLKNLKIALSESQIELDTLIEEFY